MVRTMATGIHPEMADAPHILTQLPSLAVIIIPLQEDSAVEGGSGFPSALPLGRGPLGGLALCAQGPVKVEVLQREMGEQGQPGSREGLLCLLVLGQDP